MALIMSTIARASDTTMAMMGALAIIDMAFLKLGVLVHRDVTWNTQRSIQRILDGKACDSVCKMP